MPVHKERYRRSEPAQWAARVRPIFEDFHRLEMTGEFEYPRHQHTNYEAILVERGPYRCELNGAELALTNGQLLVIKPGDWHQDHLRDGQRHYVLHFRLISVEGVGGSVALFSEQVRPEEQICRGDYGRDAWFVRELKAEARAGLPYAAAVQDGLLEALFWRIARGLPNEALSAALRQLPATERQREEMAVVFARFVRKNPNVSEIAAALRISPRHLVNRCRQLFGESPARLLLRLKLRRADELLCYRGLRVQEVSEELGFANPYHFSRAYRRLRGHAPSFSRERSSPRAGSAGA